MSNWDGKERRSNCPTFCNQHMEMLTQLTEVSTSLKGLVAQMTDTASFRRAMVSALVSILCLFFVQTGTICYFVGQMSRQITVNTARLDIIEEVARDIIGNIKEE